MKLRRRRSRRVMLMRQRRPNERSPGEGPGLPGCRGFQFQPLGFDPQFSLQSVAFLPEALAAHVRFPRASENSDTHYHIAMRQPCAGYLLSPTRKWIASVFALILASPGSTLAAMPISLKARASASAAASNLSRFCGFICMATFSTFAMPYSCGVFDQSLSFANASGPCHSAKAQPALMKSGSTSQTKSHISRPSAG